MMSNLYVRDGKKIFSKMLYCGSSIALGSKLSTERSDR